MNGKTIIKKDFDYILQTYKRYPVVFARADGKYIYDITGKKYLDFFSGIAVSSLGYNNKKIVNEINEQVKKFIYTSNYFYTKVQSELAEKLVKLSFPSHVFFSNSGAEANECAIKVARKWGHMQEKISTSKTKKYEIITFKNSFHGRTLATLSATGQKKFSIGFEPLVPGFKYAEFNNFETVKENITKKTVAIMIEPVQGEGGIYIADKKFLQEISNLCKKNNILLILDEIQCGLGRTGKMFAYQNYGIKPDILCLAKSLAQGLPLGATLISNKLINVINYGDHGSTFGGNPVACAVAYNFLSMLNNATLKNVIENGKYLDEKLLNLKLKYSFIKEVRCIGLMIGISLDIPGKSIVENCIKKGLIINSTQDKILRFLPPFIIDKKDIDAALAILDSVFKSV